MTELPLPEHDVTSIVLVGAFNPRIFHPSWFVRHSLLPAEIEAEGNVELVNNDFCAFETDWFRLEVLSDRFVLQSRAAPVAEALRDLVLGTFDILSHTPISKVGFNTHAHLPLPNEEAWHRLGHRLAPKAEFWSPILREPGTLTLTIQGERPDHYDGHVRVKTEPSLRVTNGLFLETNDEYQMLAAGSTKWVAELLRVEWEPSRKRVVDIRKHIFTLALQGKQE